MTVEVVEARMLLSVTSGSLSAFSTVDAMPPAAAKQMNTTGFIGFAATELVLLLGFVVSMLLLFVAK